MLSCRDMAPWLSTHSPTACGGKVVAPATKGGMHFPARQGGCMVLAAKGGIKNGAEGAVPPQWNGTSYLPRAEALNPSGRRQPIPDRTLGAQGQRPGGAINLREYRKAPHRSRSRLRRRRHRLSSPILRGDFSTPLRSGRNDDGPATLGPGPDPDRARGACP